MSIDPRLLERRRNVAEDRAQRNVGRLLRVLVGVLIVGMLVWLAFSPWLSVSLVRTTGVVSSDANSVLAENDVVAGTPMITLDSKEVEQALERDPWVRSAQVRLDWPDEVVVEIDERVPVLWVQSRGGWTWRAVDGHAVPGSERPDETGARLLIPDTPDVGLDDSDVVRGAAEFAGALSDQLRAVTTMRLEAGELWSDVSGFQVRLGRPVEMEAKAQSLIALLAEDLSAESTLVLVAPKNPAVSTPTTVGDTTTTGETAESTGNGETTTSEGDDQ